MKVPYCKVPHLGYSSYIFKFSDGHKELRSYPTRSSAEINAKRDGAVDWHLAEAQEAIEQIKNEVKERLKRLEDEIKGKTGG